MSNITQLPQLTGTFSVALNAGWYDVLQFTYPAGAPNAGQPVDLSGIKFYASLRPALGNTQILLDMSTENGLLVNGAQMGTLSFNVTPSLTAPLPVIAAPGAVMDILAVADGMVLSLCQQSGQPFNVTVWPGVTQLAASSN